MKLISGTQWGREFGGNAQRVSSGLVDRDRYGPFGYYGSASLRGRQSRSPPDAKDQVRQYRLNVRRRASALWSIGHLKSSAGAANSVRVRTSSPARARPHSLRSPRMALASKSRACTAAVWKAENGRALRCGAARTRSQYLKLRISVGTRTTCRIRKLAVSSRYPGLSPSCAHYTYIRARS